MTIMSIRFMYYIMFTVQVNKFQFLKIFVTLFFFFQKIYSCAFLISENILLCILGNLTLVNFVRTFFIFIFLHEQYFFGYIYLDSNVARIPSTRLKIIIKKITYLLGRSLNYYHKRNIQKMKNSFISHFLNPYISI